MVTSHIDLRFAPKLLGEALLGIYQKTPTLRSQESNPDPARAKDIQWVLALVEQQLAYGRRDHARSERMLDVYHNLRQRLEESCGLDKQRSIKSVESQVGVNIDRQLAEVLTYLMYLAAAHTPDASAYSRQWCKVLLAHVEDLRLIVSAVLNGHSLKSPHCVRNPLATGQFTLPALRPQADVLDELEHNFGYAIFKRRGHTAVCFSSIANQIVLVGADGARRDIDILHLKDPGDPPEPRHSVIVGRGNPPLVAFVRESGAIRRLRYSWSILRYY